MKWAINNLSERDWRLIGMYLTALLMLVLTTVAIVKVGMTSGPVGLGVTIAVCATVVASTGVSVYREHCKRRQ